MSMYQPLDVCINKPFKNQLCKIWYKWIANGSNSITKKENLKRANEDEIEDFDDESNKDDEYDDAEFDSDESNDDESDGDESNNRVSK
ncbi:2926_t:CDS:2 [Gigaspora margarita]|uniref:2926_t:CDS:1 n=1 Tax=Gigaspora margarita TaxID=4874 RepID=A0ABN7VJW8_GIGMA|nr:2926_t:CDS:2 [Gigaspora margarita]